MNTLHAALPVFVLFYGTGDLNALQNSTGVHDPSGIQKCGDTYWIFGTGDGIHAKYSRDLISWTAGPGPYSKTVYPSWINTYVPGFQGTFWAPDCRYMNGEYYLYYSCSTWGSKVSCIGLATNKTLDPKDPDYQWKDEGVVVYSDENSAANCIDPAIFKDADGNYHLSYGSYFGGIRILALDSVSGKPGDSILTPVASGNCEASYVIPHGDYYFLFINRGSCCQGVNSTYHIQVGRSESPAGPYLDKDGEDLNAGGGSTIHSTNAQFIGPGHIGYYVENGLEWVTYHYYDGDDNGAPKLAIATMEWDQDGWPDISNEFLEEGDYVLVNRNSQLVMQTTDPESVGSQVIQGAYLHENAQKWHLAPVGNGYYRITHPASGLIAEPADCSSVSGTSLVMGEDNFMPCETWKFERTNELEYVISSRAGNNVLNVPAPAFEEGIQIQTAIYSGIASHYWQVKDTTVFVGSGPGNKAYSGVTVFPNPVSGRSFHVRLDALPEKTVWIEIFSQNGDLVYSRSGRSGQEYTIGNEFPEGLYLIRIITGNSLYMNKFTILY